MNGSVSYFAHSHTIGMVPTVTGVASDSIRPPGTGTRTLTTVELRGSGSRIQFNIAGGDNNKYQKVIILSSWNKTEFFKSVMSPG